MSQENTRVGVGVLLTRGDHILLGKRKGSHGAGTWSPPGGKPDPGESPVDAALRELREETGITRSGLSVLPHWSFDQFDGDTPDFVTLYMYGNADPNDHAEVLEPEKCEEWRWVSIKCLDRPANSVCIAPRRWEPLFPGVAQAAWKLDQIRRGTSKVEF